MDSTPNSSNNGDNSDYRDRVNEEFKTPIRKGTEGLRKAIAEIVADPAVPKEDWLVEARAARADHQVDYDVDDDWLRLRLEEAQQALSDERANAVRGDSKFSVRKVKDVMPGFIKDGMLHMLNAEQGAGKSCFILGLFRALTSGEQTASFLNVEVNSSTNWRLFLIAPDMPKESWALPLANYGFATATGQVEDEIEFLHLDKRVALLACQDTGYSLSKAHIEEYRQMALDSVARGERPLFAFDSYSTLVANFQQMEEINAQFAQPLQDLQKAMSGTGATVIVLHHTAKSGIGSVVSSGSGTNRLGRIPDVIITMEAAGKHSDRLFLSSRKRVTPTSLIIEQDFDAGQWICHGDANEARALRDLIGKIAALKGPQEKIYEWAQQRWENQGKPFSIDDVTHLIERSKQAARNHVRKMEADGVIYQCDSEPTISKPRALFLPAEYRGQWTLTTIDNQLTTPAETGESPAPQALTTKTTKESSQARHIIPCHPVDSQVSYQGRVWTVREINLATGMHTIYRSPGITKSDLRMMDLEPFIDPDEEL